MVPESDDVELRQITEELGPLLDHHALMLSSSLDMLAVDWRSERIVDELERIDGLGAPAERLDGIYARLVAKDRSAAIRTFARGKPRGRV